MIFGGTSWQAHHIIPKELMDVDMPVGKALRTLTNNELSTMGKPVGRAACKPAWRRHERSRVTDIRTSAQACRTAGLRPASWIMGARHQSAGVTPREVALKNKRATPWECVGSPTECFAVQARP